MSDRDLVTYNYMLMSPEPVGMVMGCLHTTQNVHKALQGSIKDTMGTWKADKVTHLFQEDVSALIMCVQSAGPLSILLLS